MHDLNMHRIKEIRLHVGPTNVGAVKLYNSYDFETKDTKKDYPYKGGDSYRMICILDS